MHNGTLRIQVIGVGGGGGNAVSHIAQKMNNGIAFAAVNTDLQALNAVQVPHKLQIGAQLTRGFGSGAQPDIGRKAAEETIAAIRPLLADADLVFLAAGLGGGTGTGATPIIASVAKEIGALTIAIVTKPFGFEGAKRADVAQQGLAELRQIADTVICIPNDRVLKTAVALPIDEAFRVSDEVLYQTVSSMHDLIARVGVINIDYADIATVLKEPGDVVVGFGEGSGEANATKAVRYAIASPLLERNDISGAKQVLISLVGDLVLKDVQDAMQALHNELRGSAHIVFGFVKRDDMPGQARATLIASGLPDIKKADKRKPMLVAPQQSTMDFFPAESGRFVGLDPTLISGVNYDTPTYVRWGRKLLSDAA